MSWIAVINDELGNDLAMASRILYKTKEEAEKVFINGTVKGHAVELPPPIRPRYLIVYFPDLPSTGYFVHAGALLCEDNAINRAKTMVAKAAVNVNWCVIDEISGEIVWPRAMSKDLLQERIECAKQMVAVLEQNFSQSL